MNDVAETKRDINRLKFQVKTGSLKPHVDPPKVLQYTIRCVVSVPVDRPEQISNLMEFLRKAGTAEVVDVELKGGHMVDQPVEVITSPLPPVEHPEVNPPTDLPLAVRGSTSIFEESPRTIHM